MIITSVVSLETTKVVIHLSYFLIALTVIPSMPMSIIFYYGYSRHVSNSRETRSDKDKQSYKEEA